MRPHLKNKVRSDGVTLSWAKGALLRCSILLDLVGSDNRSRSLFRSFWWTWSGSIKPARKQEWWW